MEKILKNTKNKLIKIIKKKKLNKKANEKDKSGLEKSNKKI